MNVDLANFDALPTLSAAPAIGDRVAVETEFGFQMDRRIGTVIAVLSSSIQSEQEWGVAVRFPRTRDHRATKRILPVGSLRAV